MNHAIASRIDIDRLRAQVPALHGGGASFDGPGGTQTPVQVADAIRDALLAPLSNRGSVTIGERNADAVVLACRAALGDLLGVSSETIVFGRSATSLTFEFSRSISAEWAAGDEVVVTRLDHDSNVQPWILAAERRGATVRRVDFDPTTGELPTERIVEALSERTRLVAVTGASNLIGTMPDIPAIAAAVHAAGALLYVDGVHRTAHTPIDVPALGADFYTCSPYKFMGPHCAALTARAELLEALRPDKLTTSSSAVPERFELGTLPYELMAGTTAAVDLLAGLAPAGVTRREQVVASMQAVEAHEDELRIAIENGLQQFSEVTVHSRAANRTPTLLVSLSKRHEAALSRFLAERGISAPSGSFYALEASRALGLGDTGGMRIGLAPYNDQSDVDRLLTAIKDYFG